ncbi:MAG: rod shape-determining protein MreD [Minisyncoccales bacterium]
MKRFLIFFIFLILVTILQTTFFFSFDIFGIKFNLVILYIIFLNLFEKENKETGLWIGGIGGFLLDLYSSYYFGFFTIGMLISSLIIKIIRRNYLKFEI